MKKRILIAAGILLLVCAAGAGGWYYFHEKENTAAAEGETAYVSSISSIMGLSTGTSNRYAGVVEPQETVEVNIENGRKVTKVEVKSGDVVTQGQLLFEYDLSSIQEDLQEAKLELDRLKNEARSLTAQIETLEAEKEEASEDNLLSYTIEIETSRMNLQKNTYQQTSKEAEIQKLQNATGNTEVRSPIDGIIQKIDTSKLSNDSGDSLDESGTDTYYSAAGNGESNAFITILSTGAYRVKGSVNEQNKEQVMMMEGMPVIIRSRVDENQTWNGIMGKIDQGECFLRKQRHDVRYDGCQRKPDLFQHLSVLCEPGKFGRSDAWAACVYRKRRWAGREKRGTVAQRLLYCRRR